MKYIKNLNNKNSPFQEFTSNFKLEDLMKRWVEYYWKVLEIVKDIEKNILESWDEYSKILTEKFDKVKIDNFKVTEEEFNIAEKKVSEKLKSAIKIAKNNIENFHKRQVPKNLEPEETCSWVTCYKQFRSIEKVWLYIPGWTAPLFSTVLMLAIPARLAWCKEIIICTPPDIAPETLYTAKLLWIKNVYKIGWAQAIFSLAHWTKQIPKVDKIFGPWNSFVTAAKMLVSSKTAIDMPAWPSEVLVIADKQSNSSFVAADLLSQAEHWNDSQVVLLSDDEEKIREILEETEKQLNNNPSALQASPFNTKERNSRKEISINALKNSFAILVNNIDEAIEVSNIYAPEHLILQVENYNSYISKITNAGSVFLWKYSCESAGDYASWTNHTLPTSWYAKSYSWVWLESFWKWLTFQELSKDWIKSIWSAVELMAEAEWLDAHKNAMSLRMESLNKKSYK